MTGWARKFERLLIHLDVDVLDFADMPLAENTRRNVGLSFDQLMAALKVFVGAANWSALTVCELNPDHGASDGTHICRISSRRNRCCAAFSARAVNGFELELFRVFAVAV